jgi:hypothetical protein
MPSIRTLKKHYSKQLSGLSAYCSFLRGRSYGRSGSLDDRSPDYNFNRRKEGPILSESASQSWSENTELGQMQPVKITTSDSNGRDWEQQGSGIHVREEFHLQHEVI